jgi:ATP-dependent DNA ligase
VYLQSRTGRDLGRYFPNIVAAARQLPVGAVIDGELAIWNGERTDFSLLQQRIARPRSHHPANLVGFDLLQDPSVGVLLPQPLTRRREFLEQLLDGARAPFALCPQSDSFEQADEWMLNWTAAGVEGVLQPGFAVDRLTAASRR